jgi:DNA topoisomerase-1
MAKTAAAKKESKKTEKKSKILLIVESPAKAKTINKILGSDYEIKASYGHIRDFPKKVLGFDLKDFTPTFEVINEKKKVVKELKDAAKKADIIYLAPDPDREGEAIAWHIKEVLDAKGKEVFRVVFNEITKNAIKEAVETPRLIDMDIVRAQQTRQILDRWVGYKLIRCIGKS